MNPFDLVQKFQEFQAFGERIQNEISPEWLIKTTVATAIRFVLQEAKQAGPPSSYAERMKITEAQAVIVYNLTLDAALTRFTSQPAARISIAGSPPAGEPHGE